MTRLQLNEQLNMLCNTHFNLISLYTLWILVDCLQEAGRENVFKRRNQNDRYILVFLYRTPNKVFLMSWI